MESSLNLTYSQSPPKTEKLILNNFLLLWPLKLLASSANYRNPLFCFCAPWCYFGQVWNSTPAEDVFSVIPLNESIPGRKTAVGKWAFKVMFFCHFHNLIKFSMPSGWPGSGKYFCLSVFSLASTSFLSASARRKTLMTVCVCVCVCAGN